MILKMILKSFDFQCDFDFDFQITTSKMILISILNHLYLGDLILILKSSTYGDFAHLWLVTSTYSQQMTEVISSTSSFDQLNWRRRMLHFCRRKPSAQISHDTVS